jgi:hypothetical protein
VGRGRRRNSFSPQSLAYLVRFAALAAIARKGRRRAAGSGAM